MAWLSRRVVVASILEGFITMAVPKAQHLDGSLGFVQEIKNAVCAFENRQLLRFRVGRVPEIVTGAGSAGIAQLPDRFGGEFVRVLFAALGFATFGPIGGDFLEVVPRALGED